MSLMIITTDDSKIIISYRGREQVYPKSYFKYEKGDEYLILKQWKGCEEYKVKYEDITVNGTQLTKDNADDTLIPIFFLNSSSGGGLERFPTFDDFPDAGDEGNLYLDESTNIIYVWDSDTNTYEPVNASATWDTEEW